MPMIYTLPYQTEELLKNKYFELRKVIKPESDSIYIMVSHSHLQDLTNEDLYKKVMHLEGIYRAEIGDWQQQAVKVRITNQL